MHQRTRRYNRFVMIPAALALALVLSPRVVAAPADFYWEAPSRLSRGTGAYPQAIKSAGRVVVIWQENIPAGNTGTAWLSLASFGPEGTVRRDRFAGPFRYEAIGDNAKGEQNLSAPVLFSADDDGNGKMIVAVSSGERSVAIYQSFDGGLSIKPLNTIPFETPVVAPRIYSKSSGGWYLFVTRSQTFTRAQPGTAAPVTYDSLSIFYTHSEDGISWTPLAPFVSGEIGLDPNFLPSAASANGSDVVMFQTLSGGERPSFQLYSMSSKDGGATWSEPRRFTDFPDPVHRDRLNPNEFDNQRPNIARIGSTLWVTWERRLLSGTTQIYAARMDEDGTLVVGSPERITLGQGNCSEPRLYIIDDGKTVEPGVTWFDDRRGSNRVFTAYRSGSLWTERDISGRTGGISTFGRAMYTQRGLYAFWQSGGGSASSVIGLVPDTTARAPVATAVDFTAGSASRRSRASVRWNVPEDSSGILGFSYLWSRDPASEPLESVMALETMTRASFDANEDGDWYFSIRAQDYAGNWSTASRIRFIRDTTPPGAPIPEPPAASADGFLDSNTFRLSWLPPPEADIAGYTWILEYLGPLDRPPARKRNAATVVTTARSNPEEKTPAEYNLSPATDYERRIWMAREPVFPQPTIRTIQSRADFTNIDDGYWAFSVASIDRVGNVGAASRAILRADKFIPYTTVADVASSRNDFGALALTLIGRGFADDGAITRLAIDDDGREPFDRVYELSGGSYAILSDRLLRVAEVGELTAGSYRVGLYHPVRGWYFTSQRLSVDYSGTVKFGTMGAPWKPNWIFEAPRTALIRLTTLFMVVALIVPVLGMIMSLRHVALVAGEIKSARMDAIALLEGKPMSEPERKKAARLAIRRGAGLSTQFMLWVSLLVIFIVLLVSVPLGMNMLQTQSEILAKGLEQRARVLLESAAQGGKSYLPARNLLELSLLPNQASAVAEARYLTITGYGATNATDPDVVWASNDPDITAKLDGTALVPGGSLLTDKLSGLIATIAAEIDTKAQAEVGSIAESIQQLQDEGRVLAASLDATSQARLTQIAASARDLEKTLNERLARLADASVASEPAFNATALGLAAEEFIFYKPILFRQGRESIYYRGLVRLSVSTETIVAQVKSARQTLIRSVAIVAAIALGIGFAGSFALSRFILSPLMKVVRGIETIRDQPDKKKLADFKIDIKRQDEFAILAGTINEMSAGLAHAAAESELLTVGKGVQKMFIPLSENDIKEKLTTGFDYRPTHNFYGYYEGAKGVSGDYFDYFSLDGRFFAFIKCDVSGKGVPAALIMVGVATIFTTGFQTPGHEDWVYARDGIHLDTLTAKINDFLYKRGFKGLFAALVMGVFDSKTGNVYLCHAGDKFVRVYKPSQNLVVTNELASAPAAGAIDSELVKMSAAYKQVIIKLDPGDIMMLYTDGFEESSRARRSPDFRQIKEVKILTDHEGKETTHEEALVEQLSEERIKAITEAIMSKGTFSLVKEDDPLGPDTSYDFDFSSLEPTTESMVLGIAAVEKVFRLVPDPTSTEEDRVIVDTKIDAILEKCWKQYSTFCSNRHPHPDVKRKEYQYYHHLKEDDQYDDLTMMVIQRK